jgi:hypothetical protein
MRSPFGGGAFSSGGIADPESDDDDDDSGGGGGGGGGGGDDDPGGASSDSDSDSDSSRTRTVTTPSFGDSGASSESRSDSDSGRTPSGGPSAGAGGDPRDDDPSVGGDLTDDAPSPGEPGGTPPEFGDSGASSESDTGRTPSGGPSAGAGGDPADDNAFGATERAQAINEAVSESRFANDSQDIAIDTSGGEIETELTGDAAQAQQRASDQAGETSITDSAAARANRQIARVRERRQDRRDALTDQQEIFGDVPIENPLTGNRVEEDLEGVADEFQDSAETVFANLGRVQPTPVTLGTGGTRTADETTSGIRGAAAEGFIGAINPAEILGDAKEVGEFAVERGDEVGAEIFEPTADLFAGNPIETETELQEDLTQRGSLIVDEAQENPGETAASVIGGAVGGAAAGFGAARAGRGAVRGARSADLDDVADAVVSGRQSGGSSSITGRDAGDILTDGLGPRFRFRQRDRDPGRDLPDEQEQIERTEQIEREVVGEDTLDELARRQGVDDSVSDLEQTARQRLPPRRAFETDAEFRRELERAIRQEEQRRRELEAESRTDAQTQTQTQTGIPALSVGASAGAAGQREDTLDPDTGRDSTQEGITVGGIIGGGQQIGSLEEELSQGVGEREAVGIAEELGIGEEIGFQAEQGIGEELGIGEETGTQIGEAFQISEQVGEQITDTAGQRQIIRTPRAPRMPRTPELSVDDNDDDEPLFEDFEGDTAGVRDVEATLEDVSIFDTPTGEQGGIFR